MAFSQLFGKDRVIGIDVGSAVTKIMEIEPSGEGWRAARAITCPTPPGSCHDGLINDIPAVVTSIKAVFRGAEIYGGFGISAVSGSQVLVRQVQLPAMSEAVLRRSIGFEASKYISASVDSSIVECEILEPDNGEGMMQVMLVAVPREAVEARVAVLEGLGLEPLVVDVEAFALMRALVEFSPSTDLRSDTVALVDMGAGHTDLNIVSAGRFGLTRSIPIAGSSLTQAIKSLASCTDEQAELMKTRLRIGPALVDPDGNPPDEEILRAVRAIQPLLDELLREIRRSLHYYQSQFPEGTPHAVVNRLVLTGGTSRMPGLPEYISAKLNVRATRANVLMDGIISRGELTEEIAVREGPLFTVAAGLSLKNQAPAGPRMKSQAPGGKLAEAA